jgi:DCN1-like protein 1/2
MTQDGVCKFLQDLHFRLDEQIVLVLAWRFKAAIQGEFTRDEFYNAMNDLGFVFFSYIFEKNFY